MFAWGNPKMSFDVGEATAAVDVMKPQMMGSHPTSLTDIYQPENNIAVWKRTHSKDLIDNITHMLSDDRPLALVQSVTPYDVEEWIHNKLGEYACADALSKDIALIVDMFCCLFDVKKVGLRLTSIDRPMCPKFHVDRIPCRLVTTYVGSATEWLENEGLDRSKLGAGSCGQPDHLSGLFNRDTNIQQIQPGDVALLKGSGWEGNENGGLVHRSPSHTSNLRRLLLTLDFI